MTPLIARNGLSIEIGQAFYGAYRELRPVQRQAVGPLLNGRDVLVISRTGSGKTEAILAPLVQRYLGDLSNRGTRPALLYITPTRALANDLLRRLSPPLERLGLVAGLRHGEQNDLGRVQKPHLLITTPESLDVMLMQQEAALQHVRGAVVDESHLFYNSQRGFQLSVLLRRLELRTGPLQVASLSATVANPEDIWRFLRPGHQVDVVTDESGRDLDFELRVISQPVEFATLVERIASAPKAKLLVFVNSRREADSLAADLMRHTSFGSDVYIHHSSMSKAARLETEASFGSAQRAICVATSTLELGIDIGDIDLVVLYDQPSGWQSFLQRIGRGNRRSNKSNVLALVHSDRDGAFYQTLAFQALIQQVRRGRFDSEAPLTFLGAALQQVLSQLLESDGRYRRPADLAEVLGLEPEYAESMDTIIDELVTKDLVKRHPVKNRIAPGEALYRLKDLRLVWGNFPARSRVVTLRAGTRELGNIPAVNAIRLSRGSVISFGGRHWRVARLLPETIELEQSQAAPTVPLIYGGTRLGLDPHVVEGMWEFIVYGGESEGLDPAHDAEFRVRVHELREVFQVGVIPVESKRDRFKYFTFGGQIINEVIGRWSNAGWHSAGDVILETDRPVDFHSLPLDVSDLEDLAFDVLGVPSDLTLFQSLLPRQLLARELGQWWSQSGVIERTVSRLRRSDVVDVPPGTALELMVNSR